MYFAWSCYEPHLKRVQSCSSGLIPTIPQIALSNNILIAKKTYEAELDATSSSSNHFSPVNPIKCLLLWKAKSPEMQGQPLPAKSPLCFKLPQYGLWIHVIVVGGSSVF